MTPKLDFTPTADSSPILKTSGKPPDIRTAVTIWTLWPLTKDINVRALSVLIVLFYLMAITTTQMFGSWVAARERSTSLLQKCSAAPKTLAAPLDSWSRYIIYSNVLDGGRAVCQDDHRGQLRGQLRARRVARHVKVQRGNAMILCIMLLLCGDVHANPGPMVLQHSPQLNTSTATPVTSMLQGNILACCASKTAELSLLQTIVNSKQRNTKLYQTVNHASVLWNPKTKPKGIFGGHINIRSVISKTEQLEHILLDSNLDYLCLTETWLTSTTPLSVFTIPGYNVYRRDRGKGKGGGVCER